MTLQLAASSGGFDEAWGRSAASVRVVCQNVNSPPGAGQPPNDLTRLDGGYFDLFRLVNQENGAAMLRRSTEGRCQAITSMVALAAPVPAVLRLVASRLAAIQLAVRPARSELSQAWEPSPRAAPTGPCS